MIGLISSYTLSEARMANDAARAVAKAQAAADDAGAGQPWTFEELLRQLVDEQRYPRLYRIARSPGPAPGWDERAEFAAGLDCILDGVQAMADRAG